MNQNIAKLYQTQDQNYKQTLSGHTTDCLKILEYYFEKNKNIIENFCSQWNINRETFLRNLFIAIYLHDIGKLTKEFQSRISEGKHSQNYPHAFWGFPIVFEIFKKLESVYPLQNLSVIEPLTILSHHTQLCDGIYQEAEIKEVKPLKDEILNFVNNIKTVYEKLKFNEFFKLNLDETNELKAITLIEQKNSKNVILNMIAPHSISSKINPLRKIVEEVPPKEKFKLKSIYTYFLSILKFCDSYASVDFSDFVENNKESYKLLDSVLKKPEKYVLSLPQLSEKQILNSNKPYKFQKETKEKSAKNCLLFAPCGRGKTEASLLWAFEVCKKFNKNKIIFAMPTQTTSNAMRKRFIECLDNHGYNGKNLVGLYHGMSSLRYKEELRKENEELTESDIKEAKNENFKGEIFFKPITVTTIDHLIYAFAHGFPQADRTLGNIQNSVIIFDEVHYYERQTLKHLIDIFSILRKMHIPHLLMSGTLPEFLIKRVNRDAKDEGIKYELVKDYDGLGNKPFKIEVFKESLITKEQINNKIIDEIISNFNQNLVQFIILNTIEKSKMIFRELQHKVGKDNILLLHSQFTYKDRAIKEEKLLKELKEEKRRPFIVVATQVIEISLDISSDIMYTELAPADALGQRGGRLNRAGNFWKAENKEFIMKIFIPEKELPYSKRIIENTQKIMAEKIYSYLDLKRVCDKVYGLDYIDEFERECMNEGFPLLSSNGFNGVFEKCCIYGLRHREIRFNEDQGNKLVIRSEKQHKLDVVPEVYYNDDVNNLKVENKVKVPLWWIKKDEEHHGQELHWFDNVFIEKTKRNCYICKFHYDSSYGFDLNKIQKQNKSSNII